MYAAHFGMTEAPFALTPDPRFLYLSARHREGLAHLLFGSQQPGGFVQLTGEVGTGKTTLCRCLLEQLPPTVEVALVLNPRVTAGEFVATVCDELGIPAPPGPPSGKGGVEALYRYLLAAHGRGRRSVLIVDEAQQLTGDVLEQIRLLTNLETATTKLLQIILIGQPELGRLVARRELRQVAQRITARYHLRPFTRPETAGYIRSRLRVAGGRAALFSPAALRAVHRRAGGIPRLINVLCDRALLGAYAHDRPRVTAAIVRRASREVQGELPRAGRWRRVAWGVGLGMLGAALLGAVLLGPSGPRALSWPPAAPPGVGSLNQERADEEIKAILQDCRRILVEKGPTLDCFAIQEEMAIDL
jgi:general secretion pathway protein A